jgi:hypothetical protein
MAYQWIRVVHDLGYFPLKFMDNTSPQFPFVRGETMRSYLRRLSSSLPDRAVKFAVVAGKRLSEEDLDMTIEDFVTNYEEYSLQLRVVLTPPIPKEDLAMLGGRRRLHFRHSRSKSRRSRAKKSRAKRSKTRRSRTQKRHM